MTGQNIARIVSNGMGMDTIWDFVMQCFLTYREAIRRSTTDRLANGLRMTPSNDEYNYD